MRMKAFEVTVVKPNGQETQYIVKPGDKVNVEDSVDFDYSVLNVLSKHGENKIKRTFKIKFRRFR